MATGRRRRWPGFAAALAAGAASVLLGAAPAAAHVKVTADNPQAGARNVEITFTGEGESSRAGIAAERVVLPTGLTAADVQLVSAPPGWTFTAGSDGYTVAGPALKPKIDAVHTIRVAQLPTGAHALAFKTLETYSDGGVAHWIDLPEAGKPEPDFPAPVLVLRPAPAAAVASTTGAAAAENKTAENKTADKDTAEKQTADENAAGTIGAVALMTVALLVVVGVLLLVVSAGRRGRSTRPRP